MRPETVPELLERFGLRIGEPLSGGWTPELIAANGPAAPRPMSA
jgi:hypothetical protein